MNQEDKEVLDRLYRVPDRKVFRIEVSNLSFEDSIRKIREWKRKVKNLT